MFSFLSKVSGCPHNTLLSLTDDQLLRYKPDASWELRTNFRIRIAYLESNLIGRSQHEHKQTQIQTSEDWKV